MCFYASLVFGSHKKKSWVTLFRSHNFFCHKKMFPVFLHPLLFGSHKKNWVTFFWSHNFFYMKKMWSHFFVTVISHFLCHNTILGHIFSVTWSHFINYSYSIPQNLNYPNCCTCTWYIDTFRLLPEIATLRQMITTKTTRY